MNEDFAWACMKGDTHAVGAAIRSGFDPNLRFRSRALLNWAAQEGRDAMVSLLLAAGADPDRADSGYDRARPLHTAAGEGREIVRRLLRAGANPNVLAQGMGTPLHLAAAYGHLHCVRALIRAGADAGLRDADGKLAIDYARRYNWPAIVEFLRGVSST